MAGSVDVGVGFVISRAAIKVDLNGCARCHGDGHPGLLFQPLIYPVGCSCGHCPAGELCDDILTHWAPCPTNGEPILMLVREDDAEGH